ncbi:mannosyltransferase KTR3 KNAG_0A03780 [Huiozyma naganishii CBS 8797]|uniref:Glycosyltransferase family 15 protein n=1 Tax=Huiozyma naganishii (strain ATCC MYA-139 / BCRC 22969 / CBS 8797 / KCTC 17520 / NBRC 10181 / NCYC 3082 / Yp74L-3) TaxID=1071383 RepID=J7RES3_HUIN7|nr:hypothetical protein KNAG_0A03780 [Kazachstania naganishii CBS 8797]CCK68058.1 hypothetical protein KNAG_0A03780 [Kazachstania naganishii CBS 8797]
MGSDHRKRLTPKSALFVKKYQKGIRLSFAGLIIVLTVMFLFHTPSNSTGRSEKAVKNGIERTTIARDTLGASYIMPFTDQSQGVFHPEDDGVTVKAAMVTLARNSDLWQLVYSIRHVEDRFNGRYHYDWVFLNDQPFTDEFKRVTSALVSGKTKYGLIPDEHWSIPDFIDREKFDKAREELSKKDVPYGGSVPYRHMCRYQSGFFSQSKLLDEYEFYWRVDTDIKLYCDIQYDIFKFMKVNKKKYGFILSVSEYEATIPTLWKTISEFAEKNPQYIPKNNLLDFVSDDKGETYNMCHFWTNFEIASLDFYRSEAYREYFDYLDRSGGFFYERWGDAPVHSIAASLFLDKSEIHFFDGIGFYHPDFHSCPVEEDVRLQNKCICQPDKDQTWFNYYFCTRKFFAAEGFAIPKGAKAFE